MLELDYASWSLWVWWLYAFAAYCIVGFVWFWIRFHQLERAATQGMATTVDRYNASLRGFPNALFAKMMGKKPR